MKLNDIPGPPAERPKIGVPWDEKVKPEVPWGESVGKLLRAFRGGKRDKPKRGGGGAGPSGT
ncbi:MAG TPA: hypothetical protein VFS20_07060 [Longimicrobium sp.]|nr:hypothetical protein [Longimicrobium sp.]